MGPMGGAFLRGFGLGVQGCPEPAQVLKPDASKPFIQLGDITPASP